MRLRLWGVRGSIAVPGPSTVKYGGNTACLELRYGSNNLIIVDAGSGIRALGDELVRNDLKNGPIQARLFLSHTHWDHIIGFPFFTPIFIGGTQLEIYSPFNYQERSVKDTFDIQLSYQYFPVRHGELSARLSYHTLREEEIDLGDGMRIRTKFLNHPVATLGYRFEFDGKSAVTLFDHEPFRNVFPTDPNHPDYDSAAAEEGERVALQENRRVREFCHGADLLIHDSQYTLAEYRQKFTGWGHSSYEAAINLAHQSEARKLVLFHHDPLRSDGELDELLRGYQTMVTGKTELQLEMAREGVVYEP